jgi:hypothetical protein
MKLITKLFIFILFFIIIFKVVPEVSADVIFPECKWNEIKVSCNCLPSENSCPNATCSQCLKYKNDPKYYHLWLDIFCRKGSILELITKYKYSFEIPLLITIVLELIVFIISGYRKTKELLNIILVNCMSLFVGNFLLNTYPVIYKIIQKLIILSLFQVLNKKFPLYGINDYDLSRLLSLIIVVTLIVIFETLFLVYIAKFNNRKRVFITVIISNIVSLVLGLGILNAVYPFLSLPKIL